MYKGLQKRKGLEVTQICRYLTMSTSITTLNVSYLKTVRQPNDPFGALHDDDLVRILSANVERWFPQLTTGVVAPREQASRLGKGEGVVAPARDLTHPVVFESDNL